MVRAYFKLANKDPNVVHPMSSCILMSNNKLSLDNMKCSK